MSSHESDGPLTLEQLWDSYERSPVPRWMAQAASQHYDETPSSHLPDRFTYYALPPTFAVEKRACRLYKLALRHRYSTIFVPPDVHPETKEAGNDGYRNGAYHFAILAWLQAWTTVLSYHVDPHGALRDKLGAQFSTIFGNISACLIKLWAVAKEEIQDFRGASQLGTAAFRCCWIVLDMREYARVRTVFSACRRAEDCRRKPGADPMVPNEPPRDRDWAGHEWWHIFEPMGPREDFGKGKESLVLGTPSKHPEPRLTYIIFPPGLSFITHLHALTRLSL
ncbi:hypothetical protein IAR50_006879 [Cryptococcus sp. DSM 104548]